MITLKIGTEERTNGNIKERWIAQQIRKRRKDGVPIRVRVNIKKGTVNINLSSAACSGSGGSGVEANPTGKNRGSLNCGI